MNKHPVPHEIATAVVVTNPLKVSDNFQLGFAINENSGEITFHLACSGVTQHLITVRASDGVGRIKAALKRIDGLPVIQNYLLYEAIVQKADHFTHRTFTNPREVLRLLNKQASQILSGRDPKEFVEAVRFVLQASQTPASSIYQITIKQRLEGESR